MKFIIKILLLILTTILNGQNCPKVGLVLSGGAARGFSHIGTLKLIDSLDIKIDYIVGTSMGAVVGALYSTGMSAKKIEDIAFKIDWQEILTDNPKRQKLPHFQKKDTGKYQTEFGLDGLKPVAPMGYIHGQKVLLQLSQLLGDYEYIHDFDKLPIPFRCIAADIVTGNEVILKKGSLTEALRASLAIPTIFSPVSFGDSLLVDGGLLNNLPVDIASELGADIIIAVDAGSPKKTKKQLKNAIDILQQALSIKEYERFSINSQLADYIIKPKLDGYSAINFNTKKLKAINNLGHIAANENIQQLLDLKLKSNCIVKKKDKIINVDQNLNIKIINSIKVEGNKKFSKDFLLQNLGIDLREEFSPVKIQNSINELYSLGYFSTIYYTTKPISKNKIEIIIKVQENPLNKIRLGIRYDKKFRIVSVIDLQLTDLFISGLRLENQFQFIGLQKNIFSLFYPSRTLDLPFYPFIKLYDIKIPIEVYNSNGNKKGIYSYNSNMIGVGFGVQFINKWFLEFEYNYEDYNLITEYIFEGSNTYKRSNTIKKIFISSKIDMIDNILIPKRGNSISIIYEFSNPQLDSEFNYSWLEVISDFYMTIGRNTYNYKILYSNYNNVKLPYLFHYFDNNNRVLGYNEIQLFNTNVFVNQLKYRYMHKKDIFFNLIGHDIITGDINNIESLNHSIGYGLGITLISPLGPMDFIYSINNKSIYGNEKNQNWFHFSAGYIF